MTMQWEIPLVIILNIPVSLRSFEMPKLLLQSMIEIQIRENGNGLGQERYDANHDRLEAGSPRSRFRAAV